MLLVAAAAGQHRAGGAVRAEIVDAVDRQQVRKPRPCAVDPALDGADRAAANRRRVLVGEARSANQNQRLALIRRQLRQRRRGIRRIPRGRSAPDANASSPRSGRRRLPPHAARLRYSERNKIRRIVTAKPACWCRAGRNRCERVRAATSPAPNRRRDRYCRTARWRTRANSAPSPNLVAYGRV